MSITEAVACVEQGKRVVNNTIVHGEYEELVIVNDGVFVKFPRNNWQKNPLNFLLQSLSVENINDTSWRICNE